MARKASQRPTATDLRLLLTPAEAAQAPANSGAAQYVSEHGWKNLAKYLTLNYAELVKRRDQGPSNSRPLFLHTYALPTVRPAGSVVAPDGWLYPSFVACGIPQADRQDVSDLLFERSRQLLLGFDQGSGLEIHLSSSGYGKLGQAFGAMIDGVLAAHP